MEPTREYQLATCKNIFRSKMQKTSRFFRRRRVKAVVPGRQVQTKYGIVEGARLIDEEDCQVDAFLGIQYAKPPVGPLRFKVNAQMYKYVFLHRI